MTERARDSIKLVCQNRKARHLYHIEETMEAGLVLKGTEVKSLRSGQGSLQESYARPIKGEIFLDGFHIPPYDHGNIYNVDAVRSRKLLLHKSEIERLIGAVSRKGYTLVPLSVYFKKGRAKVELGVGKGKKEYDKREDIKQRDQQRDMDRDFRKLR